MAADVDPRRIAVIGIGQGGYLVPRALAFEHRPRSRLSPVGRYWGRLDGRSDAS